MDLFAEIADERRGLADLVSGLTEDQLTTPSLCAGWTVRDVVAHLVVPLEVSIPTFALAMLVARGSFDRANVRLARTQTRRPVAELVEVLRRKAESRFTPPGSGPEAPLTDLLVHSLDITWPLRLTRDLPAERLRTSLTYLTAGSAPGFVAKGALDGLRFQATDLDWAQGNGATVSGTAEALLMAICGRRVAFDLLTGDGVPTLGSRVS